jgi:raffinose/stachyose/melibiose transport system substrate-binding protein
LWLEYSEADPMKLAIDKAVKDYNSTNTYNAEIVITSTPSEAYKTKIKTAVAGNNMPDIFYTWPAGFMSPFAKANSVYDFNSDLNKDVAWKNSFSKGIFDKLTFNNKIYGIPLMTSATVLYYNTDMFTKFGLQPPKTWNDLVNIIKVVKSKGKIPFAADFKDNWVPALYAELIADRIGGIDMLNRISKTGKWTDPDMIAAGKKMQELAALKPFPVDAISSDYGTAQNMFINQDAAMYVMGNWDVSTFIDAKCPLKGKVGVVKFPMIPGGKGSVDNWLGSPDACFSIASSSKAIKESVAFLKSLTTKKFEKEVMEEKLGNISSINVAPDPSKVDPLYAKMLNLFKDKKAQICFYDTNFGPNIGVGFNEAVMEIMVGNSDPAVSFKKLEIIAKKELGK